MIFFWGYCLTALVLFFCSLPLTLVNFSVYHKHPLSGERIDNIKRDVSYTFS